ncbi:MAG: amidohydrolase family protein [Sphingomonas sp.]|uniref:amidohydrolase family protein n=1 Tax=Sphingomonas sp. TaxID=28214 RepID=UPI0025CF8381|nr:amidohydrolase family protein [Sphingomonas sp.]MBY0284647.1 amidohydrolase family protein [Sphingomonas sp.]
MHRLATWLMFPIAACLAAGPASAATAHPELVIRGIRIVDTLTATASPPRDIYIRGGSITRITPARRTARARTQIDGHNKFVIAGLWDLHVHLESTPNPQLKPLDPLTWYAPIAMSYGVMGLRDLGSRMEPILTLRARFDDMRRQHQAAPILKVAGSSFMGPVRWGSFDHVFVAKSPDDATEQVRKHAAAGVDIIKVHDFLDPAIYLAITAEAARQGRAVTGHLRPYTGPVEAMAAGQRDFEHLQPELFSYCTAGGQARAEKLYNGWYQGGPGYFERTMTALYNDAGCKALFGAMGTGGATVTPTIGSRMPPSARSLAAAPRYLPTAQLERCRQYAESMKQVPAADGEAYRATVAKVLMALRAAKVNLLTGSDGPPENCAVPGLILLDELDALVAAGLPRAEVLDAATRRAATKAGVADSGQVAKGMAADLVLLSGNPLKDFGVLLEPVGLVVAGRPIDRAGLEAMRREAGTTAAMP